MSRVIWELWGQTRGGRGHWFPVFLNSWTDFLFLLQVSSAKERNFGEKIFFVLKKTRKSNGWIIAAWSSVQLCLRTLSPYPQTHPHPYPQTHPHPQPYPWCYPYPRFSNAATTHTSLVSRLWFCFLKSDVHISLKESEMQAWWILWNSSSALQYSSWFLQFSLKSFIEDGWFQNAQGLTVWSNLSFNYLNYACNSYPTDFIPAERESHVWLQFYHEFLVLLQEQTFLHQSISEYKYSSAYLYTNFEHFLLT